MAIRNTEPAARSVLAVAALWAAACGTPGTPPSASAQPEIVQDLFPDRARYAPRAETTLTVKVRTGDLAYEGPLTLRIYHLDHVVHEQSRTISLRARTNLTEQFTWTAPAEDFTGYLAVASAGASARTTGIDVSSSPYRFPRYGFLSDFSSAVSPEQRADRVRVLAQRYLIDLLQFYDWQWRHEKLLPEVEDGSFQETWTDLFGREVVWGGVRQYVDAAHQVGAAALAYVMVYAAREGFVERFPISLGWGMFTSPAATNQLDVQIGPTTYLFLFDPANPSWQDWLIPQFAEAVRLGEFDGVHIDQVGPRHGLYRADGSPLSLPDAFPSFLREAKRRLKAADARRNACIFNLVDGAVDGWAVHEVATDHPCDVLYSEIWFAANTYRDLRRYVEQLRQLGNGAAVVLAAYSQYGEHVGPIYEAEEARLAGVGVSTEHPGHSGPGFVDGFDAPGDSITWRVTLDQDETVTLDFRYANASGQLATRTLLVDGRRVGRLTLNRHDLWSSWYSGPYHQLPLAAGEHEVALTFSEGDSGAANLDHLRLATFSESGLLLADAVMFASGATHIELGDDEQSLAHEYFPDRSKSLTPEQRSALRRYYSFAAAYENVLFGADVAPVLDASADLSVRSGQNLSETAGGAIHPIVRRRPGMEILHFVNLVGVEDDLWRNAAAAPELQERVRARHRLPDGDEAESAFWASPDVDGGAPHSLELARGADEGGPWVEFVLPELEYWDMVVVRTRPREVGESREVQR